MRLAERISGSALPLSAGHLPQTMAKTERRHKLQTVQLSWLAEAPPMTRIRVCCVVNFTREFLTQMERVNSKCSSAQLRAK